MTEHDKLVSKREVLSRTGLSYPTIWRWMRAGKFPRSLAVGERVMWRSGDIDGWMAALPQQRLKGDDSAKAQLKPNEKLDEMQRNWRKLVPVIKT